MFKHLLTFDPQPTLVVLTNMPGLVAAREAIPRGAQGIVALLVEEFHEWQEQRPDHDLTHHTEMEEYFSPLEPEDTEGTRWGLLERAQRAKCQRLSPSDLWRLLGQALRYAAKPSLEVVGSYDDTFKRGLSKAHLLSAPLWRSLAAYYRSAP